MNSIQIYNEQFREVLSTVFEQILDGNAKQEHKLTIGRLVFYLNVKEDGVVTHDLHATGSLDLQTIASKVQKFLESIELGSYYDLQNETAKKALTYALKYVINDESVGKYFLDAEKKFSLEIRGLSPRKVTLEGLGKEEAEKIRELLTKFLASPFLANYS